MLVFRLLLVEAAVCFDGGVVPAFDLVVVLRELGDLPASRSVGLLVFFLVVWRVVLFVLDVKLFARVVLAAARFTVVGAVFPAELDLGRGVLVFCGVTPVSSSFTLMEIP